MSVFGQQSTTNTEMATGLGQSDYSLTTNYNGSAPLNISPPPPPSSPFSITSDSWLPGTTGVDCKLVHGDRWQEIKGKMSQNIDDVTTSNYGLHSGDYALSEKYNANVVRDMYGASFAENYHAATNTRDYHGHLEEHYYTGHLQQNDVEEIETRKWKAEAIQSYSWETNPFKFELLGGGVTVAGGELKFLGAEASIAGAHIEAGAIAASFHAYDRGERALEQKMIAVDNQFKGLGFTILDVAKLAIRPVDVHTGGPSVGTAPFTPAVL